MFLFRNILFIYIFTVLILNTVSSHSIDTKRKENNLRNITIINQTSNAVPRITPDKKWQVSRLTQKRYDVVNMLWKKTKIFGDVESITQSSNINVPKIKREHVLPASQTMQKLTLSLPYLRRSSSTPSYIEFHYLDLNNEVMNNKNSNLFNKSNNRPKLKDTRSVLNSPFFVFHVQYETCKSTQTPGISQSPPLRINRTFTNSFLAYLSTSKYLQSTDDDLTNNIDMETCPLTTLPSDTMNSSTDSTLSHNSNDGDETKATTMYDKIKFFEIYDSDTPTPHNAIKHTEKIINKFYTTNTESIDNNQKVFFDDVDFEAGIQSNYSKTRFVKKHIDKVISNEYLNEFNKQSTKDLFTKTPKTTTEVVDDREHSYMSRSAAWSDFPFVAVYVYEPSQVHCDAAALSPHWLLAAASCLSRRYKDTYYVDGQSAYVAYCTDNWRNPERIAYVKRSFIHPRFDAKDYTKRQSYNIGVIQIVNSMAETCNGWAPISLISHHFDANPHGSLGVAVGWGLDRYDDSKRIDVIRSLMVYENLVHSESCPGYTEISKIKSYKNKDKDMYCLSLPNYTGENDDEVHGALLLTGGKLIALYLQEERRPSGEQSAQYTGVWRHIPWLLDTAIEPEEFVTFSLDF